MKQAKKNHGLTRRQLKSLLGGLLVFVMIFGMIPALPTTAEAAALPLTVDQALEKVADWGVMTGDEGGMRPNDGITRAEFVAMVNRAFGYTEMGEIPFTDVSPRDWYYEDICIAYNMGYFKGTNTEGTLASPKAPLTREQAAVLVARNMCLEESVGEVTTFSDSRTFSDWSAHLIEALAEEGVVGGSGGAFYPKNSIKRGEVAAMLARAIGTLVQESGEYSLGGVYGNLTITAPGVTLKDTTVVGDLYITGGLGLGDVVLENVTVLGEIIVAGAGEAEAGEHSVTLRNVAAEGLVMDGIANQFVSLKAEGLTNIEDVKVRTAAYLEDLTEDGLGLQSIKLDGEPGTAFYLAGNIKDVTNLTADSTLYMAQGIADTITIDETATGTILDIANKATVSDLNLDTAVTVQGDGDITHANVNAAGSSVSMLPDTITVRPGVTADVNGETMDTTAAAESSEDPRILSGYPAAKNVAPTSADIVFQTNKRGTLYWAVTALMDGSASEEDLIDPPSYGGNIIKSGNISITSSNTDFTEKLTGLTNDGSYYVSAILVDNRGVRSPVKITAFTTPDGTVPAFVEEPTVIITVDSDDEQVVQVRAMTNKSCLMYYALYPKGAAAPTAANFKTNSLTGNLGHGVVEMSKNTPQLVPKVNTAYLQEETEYALYLWLTDADGAQSSAVKYVKVTTLDRTSPTVTSLREDSVATNNVKLTYTIDEDGTFYWAVVKSGATFYNKGVSHGTEAGNIQIMSGINSLANGSSTAKANTPATFTISGLEPQTAYDVYFVAVDDAGNYSFNDKTTAIVNPFEIHTKDSQAPTVTQEFSHDDSNGVTPYPDSSIRLVFSEKVQGMKDLDQDTVEDFTELLALYEAYRSGNEYEGKKLEPDNYAEILREYISLYEEGSSDPVPDRTTANEGTIGNNWVIDYRKATIAMDSSGTGELIITFPYNRTESLNGLNLGGGVTYYFALNSLADTATPPNYMGEVTLPRFTTVSAQIYLTKDYVKPAATYRDYNYDVNNPDPTTVKNFDFEEFDMTFNAAPLSNSSMEEDVLWDLIFWSDTIMEFELYESLDDGKTWSRLGYTDAKGEPHTVAKIDPLKNSTGLVGVSMGTALQNGTFGSLKTMQERLYGIKLKSLNGESDDEKWNIPVTIRITAIAGDLSDLREAGSTIGNRNSYETAVENNPDVQDITRPVYPEVFELTHTFTDKTPPNFAEGYPQLVPGDSSVQLKIALDRPNSTFSYVIAPVGDVYTVLQDGTTNGTQITEGNWETIKEEIPEQGTTTDELVTVTSPNNKSVQGWTSSLDSAVKSGTGTYANSAVTITVPQNGTKLEPNTDYLVYIVLTGESTDSTSDTYCFRFSTGDVETPTIYLENQTPNMYYETSTDAEMTWVMVTEAALENWAAFTGSFYSQIGINANNEKNTSITDTGNNGLDDADVQAYFLANWEKYIDKTTLQNTYTEDDVDTDNDGVKEPVINHLDIRVIDALLNDMGTGDYRSVFDYFAKDSLYKTITNAITVSTGGTDRLYGKVPADAGGDTIDFSGRVRSGVDYYFIAAARNVQGTTYGFKAISKFRIIDDTPPTIDGKPFITLTPYTASNAVAKAGDYISYYTGSITLSFTKTPYLKVDGQMPTKLSGEITDLITKAGFETFTANMSGNDIVITFKTAASGTGANIRIFSNGYLSDSYGYHIASKLDIEFTLPLLWAANTDLGTSWTCTWGNYSWSSGN